MKKTLLYTCLWVCSTLTVQAQLALDGSLQQAIDRAVEKSAALKNQRYDIDKLHLQRQGVLNTYLPRVEGSAMYAYLDNKLTVDVPTFSTIGGLELFEGKRSFDNSAQAFHAGLTAKVPLFTGMQVPNGAKALQQKIEGTNYLMEAQKDDIVKEVISSFDQIALLNQADKLIVESEIRLDKETQRVEKAIALGLAIPYDRDKIKFARLELNSKKVETRGSRKVLYQKIRYLTDYTDREIEAVQYELTPYLIPLEGLNAAEKQELKALESFKSAMEYLIKKEKGTFLPTVGAFAGLSYTSLFDVKTSSHASFLGLEKDVNLKLNELTISPNWMVGVALKWEIFSGLERKHKVEEAQINAVQMQTKIDDTREKLELLLNHNYAKYEVLLEKIAIADQQEKIANNNLTMAVKQYQQGLITVSERLEAENDIYKAALNRVNTLIEQRLSAIETITTTGQLTHYFSTN
ncbi:TolC family protein [Flavobacterium sp. JP2137]|uniref:TolC family protein n=1 Tax=Flavobacterium sp. JP2137 TaxID=3414510 RepID=UPI003D2FE4FB